MKWSQFIAEVRSCFRKAFGLWLLWPFLLVAVAWPARAGERRTIQYHFTESMTNAPLVAPSVGWKQIDLVIGLPLRNPAGLGQLLAEINNPTSPNFHHYLTPEQFTEQFGPTEQDYEAVVHFAQSHGLIVTGRHSNRMVLDVKGMVPSIEQAFHVKLGVYQHPKEPRTFFAPDRAPTVDAVVPILSVSGLDNFELPHPMNLRKAATGATSNATGTGSGPSGTYRGYDFRAAYLPGVTLTGSGQTVGLLEFDSGYYNSDILSYESLAGLPNVPVQAVLLDGYNGGAGEGNDEVSLDIEMAISIAPGLSQVLVYEGSATDDILNRMATDDTARQIGASWTYPIDATSEQIFKEFAVQGQTFFNASGDSDAYTGTIPSPSDDTNLICVGGTTLTTTGPGGAWAGETVWNWGSGVGSSGGISTVNAIPGWQQGLNMTSNQGSTTFRNLPDVAMVADNIWVAYGNGQSGDFGGTSCATPLWAGFTALANQLALANSEPAVGFLNPAIYAIGKGSNAVSYTNLFHDITTGNNESSSSPSKFSAVPGYDLCTGWGTPGGSNLLTALALPEPLRIAPGSPAVISGPVGGPFNPTAIVYTLSNSAAGALNWTLVNTSSWFSVFPTNGTLVFRGPASNVVASLNSTAAGALPAGSYPAALEFTNLTDNFGQTRWVTLAVVTPPVITSEPANQAVLQGMAANFTVGTGPDALLFYQWQYDGTNLSDGGNIFGSATGTLTISNVAPANVGSYSVIVSNAAGVMVSSNVSLTIIPSPPVIVQQPTNQDVLPGAPASFNVAAVGNQPFYYQWQFDGTNLTNNANVSGATGSFLVVSNVAAGNAGAYSVIVTNALGSTTSTGAVLSIIPVTAPGVAMFTTCSFTNSSAGQFLYSPVTQGLDGNLYGTTFEGGTSGWGTVFRTGTNGGLTRLYSFNYNNGGIVYGGLVLGRDGYFYGATYEGGTYGYGTIFRISPSGALQTLASLNGEDGMFPVAGLVQGMDGSFYGTTLEGGDYGYGTVFKVTSGGVLTTLMSFDYTNGAYPSCVLVQAANGNFYGTTELGGTNGLGTLFNVSSSGGFTLLYSFSGAEDGAEPIPGLIQGVDGNFYGNTITGGGGGYGTLFQLTPSGALNVLYSFTNGIDGANPWGGLMQAGDGNLYGTTEAGGAYGYGTVFRIAPGSSFNPLAQFESYNGATPAAALIQASNGSLYGTTEEGGLADNGTVYQLSFSGALQITGQPQDQSAYLGGTAQFAVATAGSSPVYYQWQQDGVDLTDGGNISGSTNAILVITNVNAADAAVYSVVVSNAFGPVTSDYAVLDVSFSPPNITSQPASVTCVAGMTASFTVSAAGDAPLTYQWQENGMDLQNSGNIAGATGNTLTLSHVTAANAGVYSVIVSNPLFAVSSAPAILTVVPVTAPSAAASVLHSFTGAGSDGAFPYAGLTEGNEGYLYGTTVEGGSKYVGTVFRSTASGGFLTLYSFTDSYDGADPYARLVQSTNGYLYGTTYEGGTNGYGTIFKMTTAGVIAAFHSFTGGTDGGDPYAGLVQGADGNYYGTAYEDGADAFGTIYKVTASGAVSGLYQFTDGDDGAYPYAGLIQGTNGLFYGTALEGGADGFGTVFSVNSHGTLTPLVSFNYGNGAYPEAGVIQGSDGNFYGTTYEGGAYGYGTVFSVSPNGTLTTLFSFGSTNGANPAGSLTQGNDGNFYGTTSAGGPGGQGSVFKITTNGVLTTLLWFNGFNGASPQGALIQANNGEFYGTTPFGGPAFNPSSGGGYGILFQLTVPVFVTNSFASVSGIGNLPYSANITGRAIAPSGDPLSFAKVSGPAWLVVGTNGIISGTPPNANLGTNTFTVSLTDSNGVTAFATLTIVVNQDPAPSFINNPFTEPYADMDEDYSGTIATNALDIELPYGDVLTFGKISGPAWLNVAADGTLSGTPESTDGGTNVFIVGVTNLGGLSSTATLNIYVYSPPYFAPQNFSEPAATAGLPYAGSIATNAMDPDLSAGDVLTFYKVSGPAWLTMSANGTLSGTPGSGDVGIGTYLVLAVNSGGLAGIGTMSLTVNTDQPPAFVSNPFTEPHASPGYAYLATVATNASDPNVGDTITFAKIGGPAWLTVAPNGTISGTPAVTNAGTNIFAVTVTDSLGLSNQANMFINVAAPIYLGISQSNGQIILNWTGGYPPYQVQTGTNLLKSAWGNLGGSLNTNTLILTATNPASVYRVWGQ